MKNHSFRVGGILKNITAVIGTLSDGVVDRPAMVLLNPGKNDYHKRKNIQLAKEEAQGTHILLPGESGDRLHDCFARHVKNDIVGRIDDAYEAQPTLDVIATETDAGLIIMDCYDKESFWASLRAMKIDADDLFALAELDALKPGKVVTNAMKPIVSAHKLCTALVQNPTDFFGASTIEYSRRIRAAVKVKAPDISYYDQMALALYNRDLALYEGRAELNDQKMFNRMMASFKLKNIIRRIFSGEVRTTETIRKNATYEQGVKLMMQIKNHGKVSQGKHQVSAENQLSMPPLIYEGDPEILLKELYGQMADIESISRMEPLLGTQLLTLAKVQFRQGIHRLPYDTMLVECNIVERGEHKRQYFALLRLDRDPVLGMDTINLNLFADKENDDGQKAYFLHAEEFTLNLNEDGSVRSFYSYDRRTGTEETVKEFNVSYMSLVIAQTLSVIARMNEPDFAEHRVKPQRGTHSFTKNQVPYFEAIDVSNLNPAASYARLGPQGDVEGGVALHRVRRHQRRIFDQQTGQLKEIIPVKSHLRGSASVGVRAGAHDMS